MDKIKFINAFIAEQEDERGWGTSGVTLFEGEESYEGVMATWNAEAEAQWNAMHPTFKAFGGKGRVLGGKPATAAATAASPRARVAMLPDEIGAGAEIGDQCAWKDCRQLDFLPIKCYECNNSFCDEHSGHISHDCPNK